MFDDWRYRWSQLTKNVGRWHVIVDYEQRGGTDWWPILRPVHWWSPRDWVRFPLHYSWMRSYW
jgi:hypothetical protein